MIEFYDAFVFTWFLCSFGPPSRILLAYHMEKSGMQLHDVVGVHFKNGATTDNKAQVPSICAEECMLGIYWCVI